MEENKTQSRTLKSIAVAPAMSVWSVVGRPMVNGCRGAHRQGLYLLPLTATSGDVQSNFVRECRHLDSKEYDGAEIDEIRYYGWVFLPPEQILPPPLPAPKKMTESEAYGLWMGEDSTGSVKLAKTTAEFIAFRLRLKRLGIETIEDPI